MEPQFATSPPFPKRFSSWASDSQGLSAKQTSSNGKQPKTLDTECIPSVKLRKIRTGKHKRRESRQLTTSSCPQDRGHFSLCYFHDHKVILMGGDNSDHEYSDVWELSLLKRGWSKRMELSDPLTGHQSLNLSVVLKDHVVKEDSRRLFTYGGWQLNKYNEAIYMLDMATMQLKKCPRSVPKLKIDEHKGAKTMIDPKKKIELEKSIPEGRRDHTMLYHSELNAVIMIGGWNALEWSPHKVELEIWLYRSDWKWRKAVWKMPQAIPLNRRGHTAVYDEATNSIYVFGGIFGYSKVLGDFHKLSIGDDLMVTSIEIKKKSSWDHFPSARAWQTSTLVGRCIYMIGGLKGITETLGELLIYSIDQGYWIRVYQNEILLNRCAHSAIEYSGSIVLLGGYRYSKSAELDSESLDQSGGGSTSRPGSFLAQESKPTYISLSEIAVIDTKPTSDLPELKWVATFPWDKAFTRSKSSDNVSKRVTQAKHISTKDKGHGRLEWNITIFPSDQMTHQMDAFSNTQRSGFLQNSVNSTKQPEVSIDPFADLKDTD